MDINNEFSYKNFSINALFDIKEGGDQYSRNLADIQRNGVGIETIEKERLNTDRNFLMCRGCIYFLNFTQNCTVQTVKNHRFPCVNRQS